MNVAALHRIPSLEPFTCILTVAVWIMTAKPMMFTMFIIRAMRAAEIINARHGWEQPQEVRDMRKDEIAEFCEYTLQKMDSFDIDKYFNLLRMKGYEVKPKYDNTNAKLVAIPSAKMPQYSRLLPSVEGSWHHSLKPHGRRCILSLLRSRCDLLHLPFHRLALLALLL